MQKVLLALVLVVAAVVLATQAVNPGFKIAVTQTGLTYGHTVGLLYLQERLSGKVINVPDQSGEKDSFEWQVTGIQISKISIPAGSVSIVPGVGIAIATSGLSAELVAHWHVREKIWPHPSGSGEATVDISQTSASTRVHFGISPTGHPTCDAENTGASIGNVNIHFSGSKLDLLLDLLKHVFENMIKSAAEKQMASEINNEIDNALNGLLATWPTLIKVGDVAEVDYSLVGLEVFTAAYMGLPLKGEVFQQNTVHTEAPFAPPVVPDPTGGSSMAQIFVTSYVPNTAMYTYYKAGKLSGVITNAMVPPQSPIQFNTSFWQGIVPALYKAYPNWLMQMTVNAATYPTLTFSAKNGIKGNALADMIVQVINPKTQAVSTAFVVSVNATGDASMAVSGNNITAKITFFNTTFTVASSNIGPFDPTQLDGILLFAIEGIIVPYLNNYLAQGFPIPAFDGLKLVSPTLSIQDNYIAIASSFFYPNP